ncbi:MAG TPA: serine/threonine-protein kinase, partial [Nannocystaceae bacterium]|nr:serine/threonine-protein kinase [Nannocystaceae bacterium]
MSESLQTEGDSRETLPRVASPVALVPGSKIDRYVVLSRLGAGGMGVVLSAYDPELDRKVALKVLHAQTGGRDSREARRLVREAMAMARLNHPNVITVHDVGEHEGRVFIAMELVEGHTLRQRLQAEPLAWETVVDVFIAAGRGLACAHAKGLVHRDFKPDNVMIGDEQRIRVMDFGLARDANDSGTTYAAGEIVLAPRSDALAGDLTHAGKIVGTPGYMAPEQHRGEPADAKSDQFAFCVALYEALFRRRPFEGESVLEIAASIVDGRIRPVPSGVDVPVWVRRIVLRGLAIDPAQRWPSMDALLDALGQRRARQRTRRWSGIALGGSALGVAIFAGTMLDRRSELDRCNAAGAAITSSWNDEVSAQLGDSVTVDAPAYARIAYERATPWLDEYAHEWQRMRTEVCVATRVEEERSTELEALSIGCLDERRMVFDSLLSRLATGGAPMAYAAVEAASGLPPLASCMDDTALARDRGGDPVESPELAEIRQALADSAALHLAARYAEGVTIARDALRRAIAAESVTLEIQARLRLAALLIHTVEVDAAAEQAEQAFFLAGRIGDDGDAAEAASSAASVLGFDLRRVEDGLEWARLAEMALARLGEADTPRVARCRIDIGQAYLGAGDYARAQELFESALAIYEREVGPDHPRIADVYMELGLVAVERGDFSEAEHYHTTALGIAERAYGLEHPAIAKSLNNIAVTLD